MNPDGYGVYAYGQPQQSAKPVPVRPLAFTREQLRKLADLMFRLRQFHDGGVTVTRAVVELKDFPEPVVIVFSERIHEFVVEIGG
jgi:hypothetical protein